MDTIVGSVPANLFIPLMGLFYLFIKLVVKQIIHKVALPSGEPLEFFPVISWFGVDLAVLALAVSISLNVPEKYNYCYHQIVIWYVIMVSLLIISFFLYAFYIKKRKSLKDSSRKNPVLLFFLVIANLVPGAICFTPTLKILIK